jgi:hypothetical protein
MIRNLTQKRMNNGLEAGSGKSEAVLRVIKINFQLPTKTIMK